METTNKDTTSHKTQIIEIGDKEWRESFVKYYFEELDINEIEVNDAISVLTDDENARVKLVTNVSEILNRNKAMVGTIGEAHLSYLLEKRMNIVLTKAGWKSTPLDVTKGVDLVGVGLDDFVIVFAEAKTSRTGAFKDKTMEELRDDLSLSRTEKKFKRRIGLESYSFIVATFKRVVLKKGLTSTAGFTNIDKDFYLRIGSILTKSAKIWGENIDNADPGDSNDKRPCKLVLYVINDLSSKFAEISALLTKINEERAKD